MPRDRACHSPSPAADRRRRRRRGPCRRADVLRRIGEGLAPFVALLAARTDCSQPPRVVLSLAATLATARRSPPVSTPRRRFLRRRAASSRWRLDISARRRASRARPAPPNLTDAALHARLL